MAVGVTVGSALLLIGGICGGITYISLTVPGLLRDVSASLRVLQQSQAADIAWQKERTIELERIKLEIAILKQQILR